MPGLGAVAARRSLDRTMPATDELAVRAAAARAAAMASELRRVRSVLAGSLGASTGWTGTARTAFEDAVADRLRTLVPMADRYDNCAAALAVYARSVALAAPGMITTRSRLAQGCAGDPSVTDEQLAGWSADFDRAWHEWDTARRRCVAALDEEAGRVTGRHGLGGLLHHAAHLAHEVVPHVSLHELSNVLSDLSDALTVAGVVLSLVCPPAAAVVWTAVAVASVAKLAVDGARYASGDAGVTGAGLVGEAAGVLPGGRLVRGLHTAEEAGRAIERLAPEERVLRLVPGGGLAAHEAAGGHTIERHVGKSETQLRARFSEVPVPSRASTFTDRETAERVTGHLLWKEREKVARWVATGSTDHLRLDGRSSVPIGATMAPGTYEVSEASSMFVVLRREPRMQCGYFVLTAFPKP